LALANETDLDEFIEIFLNGLEVFVHAFIQFRAGSALDEFGGPRHHFEVIAPCVLWVEVGERDSSLVSASSQHHVPVFGWLEASAHVNWCFVSLLHATCCSDLIAHNVAFNIAFAATIIGVGLLFLFSQ